MKLNSLPRSFATWSALMLAALITESASAQIHQLKELNAEQLRTLPRDKTVVLMPGAYIGAHGPYLPCFVDGFRNAWLAQELAKAIVERPGWHVVMFPFIPIGQGGAKQGCRPMDPARHAAGRISRPPADGQSDDRDGHQQLPAGRWEDSGNLGEHGSARHDGATGLAAGAAATIKVTPCSLEPPSKLDMRSSSRRRLSPR
jgi:hypothetical protein